MDPQEIERLEQMLGHTFSDQSLLKKALTHASLADHRLDSNERLEFLGDAILGMVVCEELFRKFDQELEGELTKIKSTVVSRHTCAEVGDKLGLVQFIRLGKGMANREDLPGSVVAAMFESLIGALFLDGGIDLARKFILGELAERIEHAAQSGHQSNFKSVLQQSAQQLLDAIPQYVVLDEQGPDHAKCFEVCVEMNGQRFGSSWGPSKKQAEQQAALNALFELDIVYQGDDDHIHVRDIEGIAARQQAKALEN
ncbi:MAG: ribonuclease III [Planctomycetota bacterium]|nr:ribonuclease III [Planctomycetota bacterium]